MNPMSITPAQDAAPVYCARINIRANGALTTVDTYVDQYDSEGSSRHFETRLEAEQFAAKAATWARPAALLPSAWPRVPERLGRHGV